MTDLLPLFLRLVRQEERERDFTVRQLSVLLLINARGAMTVRAMAAEMGIPKPSVVRAIDALQRIEFVRRREDPNDRRSVLVSLRAAGQRFVDGIRQEPEGRTVRVAEPVGLKLVRPTAAQA